MALPTVFSDERILEGFQRLFSWSVSRTLYSVTWLNASFIFQADVQEHLGRPDAEVEGTPKAFQAAIAYVTPFKELSMVLCLRLAMDSKYRYMDGNLGQRKKSLEDKIPNIQKTLDMVVFLQERRVSFFRPLVRAWPG